jgi:hypothetical protein
MKKFKILLLTLALTSCATQKLKGCNDQDYAVVLKILTTTIDLKLELMNEIQELAENFGQKKISKDVFEKNLSEIERSIQQINSAGHVGIANFEIDHPDCKIEKIMKLLN